MGDTKRINRGRGHSYQLDGQKSIGVTTALSNGFPKPALVHWAASTIAEFVIDLLDRDADSGEFSASRLIEELRQVNEGRSKPTTLRGAFPRVGLAKVLGGVHWDARDEAANRGTEVHDLAAKLADGEGVEVPDELAGHVESYLQFLEDWQPTDATVEFVVVNRRWGYMGTADMMATIEPFGRVLLDVKTSRSGIFPETTLQLAGYANAETYLDGDGAEFPVPEFDAYFGLWVRADGYDLIPLDVTDLEFRIFLYAKAIGEWNAWPEGRGKATVGEAVQVGS